MPIVVVTRLRLRDHTLVDEFFAVAVALLEQAKSSPGVLKTDALADENDVWWSLSGWESREAMRSFVETDPHLSAMAQIDHFCDQATFVDWQQEGAELPDWQTSYDRLVADGESATLSNASPGNARRDFPAPVTSA
jgi:quinol monooxygenase YgiN